MTTTQSLSSQPLSIATLIALSDISQAAQTGARVRRLIGDEIYEGVARSIGDERGYFLQRDQDVRDAHLRVSGIVEVFWPVAELVRELQAGAFAIGD